mmetsp:Transcript_26035/g.54947  ORF Transcript_26035/g.54947 Transcript_26035/m.54947 type:complete len:119 (+) Transcript_26035:873-1229(+)
MDPRGENVGGRGGLLLPDRVDSVRVVHQWYKCCSSEKKKAHRRANARRGRFSGLFWGCSDAFWPLIGASAPQYVLFIAMRGETLAVAYLMIIWMEDGLMITIILYYERLLLQMISIFD